MECQSAYLELTPLTVHVIWEGGGGSIFLTKLVLTQAYVISYELVTHIMTTCGSSKVLTVR